MLSFDEISDSLQNLSKEALNRKVNVVTLTIHDLRVRNTANATPDWCREGPLIAV